MRMILSCSEYATFLHLGEFFLFYSHASKKILKVKKKKEDSHIFSLGRLCVSSSLPESLCDGADVTTVAGVSAFWLPSRTSCHNVNTNYKLWHTQSASKVQKLNIKAPFLLH